MIPVLIIIAIFSVAFAVLYHYQSKRLVHFEQNDIVLLKRKYKERYPEIGLGNPLRIIRCNGHDIEVTYVKTKDAFICNTTVNVEAVKKV